MIEQHTKHWSRVKVYANRTVGMMSQMGRGAQADRRNGEAMELGNKCRDVVLDGGIEEVRECLMVQQGDDRIAKVVRALGPGCNNVQEGLEVL